MRSSVRCTMIASRCPPPRLSCRSKNSSAAGCGNFGAPPNPPFRASKDWASCSEASARTSGVRSSGLGSSFVARRSRLADLLRVLLDLLPPLPECAGDRFQNLREPRHPHPVVRRKIGAPVERRSVRRQKHVERPAAVPGHRLHRGHVERVEIRALLPVDLDVDEEVVHRRRDLFVLERFVLHHVAPVAGGVARH